ncbi:hypothetical protein AB0L41_42115 [Amycolatopsis mediterranei]|uniref:hypothetical protein n=1 Tax=Amycolatopsis mediterranei TaxID=33910 RepID=UPI00344876BB
MADLLFVVPTRCGQAETRWLPKTLLLTTFVQSHVGGRTHQGWVLVLEFAGGRARADSTWPGEWWDDLAPLSASAHRLLREWSEPGRGARAEFVAVRIGRYDGAVGAGVEVGGAEEISASTIEAVSR